MLLSLIYFFSFTFQFNCDFVTSFSGFCSEFWTSIGTCSSFERIVVEDSDFSDAFSRLFVTYVRISCFEVFLVLYRKYKNKTIERMRIVFRTNTIPIIIQTIDRELSDESFAVFVLIVILVIEFVVLSVVIVELIVLSAQVVVVSLLFGNPDS